MDKLTVNRRQHNFHNSYYMFT
ncbi:conserved hypothetical protein [Mesorhizobium ventifaucium]|uniref:Uncharacterized protein n=1 Tax=Mesorhizobium ventifaucium TaxID=666020 RepID=A0ABM9E6Z6_9HYPH|nr:conserved hypothetical protein [Mesorhizobium ventifaucium]